MHQVIHNNKYQSVGKFADNARHNRYKQCDLKIKIVHIHTYIKNYDSALN